MSGLRRAVEYYQEAVRLDSTFALAYAALGAAQTALASWRVEPERNARAARASITRALRLAPDLADAHASAGEYHFLISHDAEQGLRELERARALRPNDAGVLSAIAFFEWRLRGPQGRSLAFAERAVVLDPQSNKMALDLARFYVALGRYDEAERLYDRAIERDPHSNGPYVMKAFVRLLRDGDTLGARTIVRRAALVVDSTALVTAAAATAFGEIGPWATLGMLDEPYQRALLTLPPPPSATTRPTTASSRATPSGPVGSGRRRAPITTPPSGSPSAACVRTRPTPAHSTGCCGPTRCRGGRGRRTRRWSACRRSRGSPTSRRSTPGSPAWPCSRGTRRGRSPSWRRGSGTPTSRSRGSAPTTSGTHCGPTPASGGS